MDIQSTPADQFRGISMTAIWIGVFLIVMLILGVLNPVQAIEYLLENNLGIGDAGQEAIAYVGGFTLPLTAGITIIMFSILKGWHRRYELWKQLMIATVILIACGFASWIFHLGLPPLYGHYISGYPIFSIPLYVISAYLNSYGIELMICSLAIGTGVALQLERWQHGKG